LGDLAQETLEASVFLDRCLDLLLQVPGDVNGPGLAADLEGDVEAAAGLATEGGGQGRTSGRELADAGVAEASDEGRVLGDAHGDLLSRLSIGT
jgi:hypothetical protein